MVTHSGATARIAVDAMGGDLGPAEVVAAAKLALADAALNPLTLVGNQAVLEPLLRQAGLHKAISLRLADGATAYPLRGHVAILDVLHYLPAERQRELLDNALAHLAPGGLLIIRNVLRERSWRYHATRVSEFFLSASGWMRVGAQHYPSADELREPLEHAGLGVTIRPLHGRMPYDCYLIVGEKPSA